MTDHYEFEKNKVVCKELVHHYLNHILATNNDKLKLLFSEKTQWSLSIFCLVSQQDYNAEKAQVEAREKNIYFRSNPSDLRLFTMEKQTIENKIKAANPTPTGNAYFTLVKSLDNLNEYINQSWNSENRRLLAEEIAKPSNYDELFKLHKIEKKIQAKLRERERKLKAKVAVKATTFNLSEQKSLVHNISHIFRSKQKYKDHPLAYFFKLYENQFMANQVDTTGKKLGDFFINQLSDELREELIQDLLSSNEEVSKRFAMVFDKSNAILGSLDNNEFIRECAGFLLKKEEENKDENS